MVGPTKRTRTTSAHGENELPTPSPSPPAPTTPSRRRTIPAAGPSSSHTTTTTPSPARPIPTRSATTQTGSHTPLTRSASLFTPSTRRSTNAGASTLPSLCPSTPSITRSGGTLFRTQSTPAIPSPASLKSTVSSGGGQGRGKGDDGPDFEARGARRLGKGKENIPPQKDEQVDDSASRKRIRTGRRSSAASTSAAGARARSGSVSSMRSEGAGRLSSVASSPFSCRPSCLPSPSPSPSTVTTRSYDSYSATPFDPLDELDYDRTPTKSKSRAANTQALLTPPPSSPVESLDTVDETARRIGLVRMKSDFTQSGTSTDSDEGPPEIRHANPYKHVKAHLRLSINANQAIVGRDDERKALRAYLADANSHDVGMYVSGPPGTGKTATVSSIGRELCAAGWRFVELGCMGLKHNDLWARLAEQLGCEGGENDVLANLRNTPIHTVILLDEVDSLLPPPPTAAPPGTSHLLSKLFSLPTGSGGRTKLVAISNTLDLTFRARLVLPEGSTPLVLPFKAYAGSDMINIVASRLAAAVPAEGEGVKVDPKAVELLTKKVEAQNGDLRMCLGVLWSAISLAEVEWTRKTAADPCFPLIKISLPHTIKAFNSHTQQLQAAAGSAVNAALGVTGKKIKSVPLQGKMVLVAALVFITRVRAGLAGCPSQTSGNATPTSPAKTAEAMTMSSLYATYVHLLSHHSSPFPPSSESDYRDLLSNLEVLGLVSVGSGTVSMARKGAHSPRVELCVREQEVREGLGLSEDAGGKGMADEEVAKVWEREDGRVRRIKDKVAATAALAAEV